MVQTPQQRRANEAFARRQDTKRGKPEAPIVEKKKPQKSPISRIWLLMLVFVVCGGLLFELLRMFFGLF